jgi:hypothetical protein
MFPTRGRGRNMPRATQIFYCYFITRMDVIAYLYGPRISVDNTVIFSFKIIASSMLKSEYMEHRAQECEGADGRAWVAWVLSGHWRAMREMPARAKPGERK